MTTSPLPSPIGASISGRYQIRRKLGSGSLGAVFLAHDAQENRRIALKIIRASRAGSAGLEQVQREFRAIASLRHPQIAAAYDFGYAEDGRVPFFTREYIEGDPLSPGPPGIADQAAPQSFLRPFLDLLDALHYLHAHGILHLDIHPGNLIVAKDKKRGSVLIDFGLFKPGGSPLLIEPEAFVPPEIADQAPLASSDLYSVGRLLLYRLTGSAEGEPRLPREIPGWGPRLTLDLERIAVKAMQRDPRRRFQSAAEFREALSRALGEAREAPRPVEPRELTASRERELEAIEESLRAASAGRPAVLWFYGCPGVGKSRLLLEARWRAQLRGFGVADARFFSDATAEPPLLRSLRLLRDSHPAGQAWLSPLSPEHGGSTSERALRAAQAYFAEDGSPVAFLLDDFEHADRESRLLIRAFLEQCAERLARGSAKRGVAIFASSRARPGSESGCTVRKWLQPLRGLRARESERLLRALLGTLTAPRGLIARIVRDSKGIPFRLRQAARALHAQWGEAGRIPQDAAPLAGPFRGKPDAVLDRMRRDPACRRVLTTLAHFFHPCSMEDLCGGSGLPQKRVKRELDMLEEDEIVVTSRQGRSARYRLASEETVRAVLRTVPESESRALHSRPARTLRRRAGSDCERADGFARHLLAAKARGARPAAARTAAMLRRRGFLHNAVQLLAQAFAIEKDPRARLRLAEQMSSIHEETGDHKEGISVLEPVQRGSLGPLGLRDAVRIARRLGVHYHRAGLVKEALRLFGEARRKADPELDLEELAFVDSELAELHTLRGEYALAEEACRRGLERLSSAKSLGREKGSKESRAKRRQLQVTLLASSGHLDLRRMKLDRALEQLQAAARLASGECTTALQALILNNLGIVHNQRNDFSKAGACFGRAKRLLLRSGEQQGLIQLSSNLALIAAKTGDAAQAKTLLEHAGRVLLHHSDRRLEFFVGEARGIVAYYLGDMAAAASAFQKALPLGRKLGDIHLTRYGEVFLSDALIECGRYGDALRQLHAASRSLSTEAPGLLRRMVHTRLALVEILVGRPRAAESSLKELEALPRSHVHLLESWNDLFIARARALRGESAVEILTNARRTFQELGIPAGVRLAQAGLLDEHRRKGDVRAIRSALRAMRSEGGASHRGLSVLEPLEKAEAHLFLGDLDSASASLEEAALAIVGLPLLELDWRIELAGASLAERRGDREGARVHLHRCLHTRELLASLVPRSLREGFLAHPRFRALDKILERLERPATPRWARGKGEGSLGFQRLIGRSREMERVHAWIERLRDQDLPVLILGETGTGKEVVARSIHESSRRRSGPFEALSCGSMPLELFESELFGFEAGAFTGAEEAHEGILLQLKGGTLLLDEASSLAPENQAKLLRVLETRQVRPLGGSSPRPLDVRFLASSSTDLDEAVKSGAFRADLYYRLKGVEIRLPPLRSRKEDIPLLASHFLELHSKRMGRAAPRLGSDALERLMEHDWPGNVRELEAVLLRLLISSSPHGVLGGDAVRQQLPQQARKNLFEDGVLSGRSLKDLKQELERAYLTRRFREAGGDVRKMASALGVKRISLYIWLRRIGLDVQQLRREL